LAFEKGIGLSQPTYFRQGYARFDEYRKGTEPMKIPMSIMAAASLVAFGGMAKADDHLFNALLPGHGLFQNDHSQAVEHSEEAPGQGSPFTGEVMQTPSSFTVGGNPADGIGQQKPNANIKERQPK